MVNVIETFDAKETFALGEKIGKRSTTRRYILS